MKKKLCILFLLSFLFATPVLAQDDDLPPNPEEPDVPPAPINQYLPVLVLAGVAYTSFKLIGRKGTNAEKLR